jgi:hypothetical protein
MTIFGWDASHYDGVLSTAVLTRARQEGIAFFSHKIAEGLYDTEGRYDDTALAAARTAGIEFIGGYLVPRSNASVSSQVDLWLRLADAGESWWRQHPGWFWQIDLERWSYDNVAASTGIAAAKDIRARTGRWTVLYASHGQYGDELKSWDGPIWNADYVSSTASGFFAMYPGDNWQPWHSFGRGGWASYSGREPTFLQYTDRATIAGLTTCDANAYRGSIDQLRALITGDPGDNEVELTDSIPGTSTPNHPGDRTVQDIFHDTALLRAVLYGELPPPANTPLNTLLAHSAAPIPVTLTDAQMQILIDGVSTKLAGLLATPQQIAMASADEQARRLSNG